MHIPTLINRGRNGFNMTPMIDVVFLLIIFFLVASHLSDQDTQIELDLPQARSATRVANEAKRQITLNVLESGKLVYSGRTISLQRFEELLTAPAESNRSDVSVRIRASKRVPFENVEPILATCARNLIWEISFATYPEGLDSD